MDPQTAILGKKNGFVGSERWEGQGPTVSMGIRTQQEAPNRHSGKEKWFCAFREVGGSGPALSALPSQYTNIFAHLSQPKKFLGFVSSSGTFQACEVLQRTVRRTGNGSRMGQQGQPSLAVLTLPFPGTMSPLSCSPQLHHCSCSSVHAEILPRSGKTVNH